MWISIVAVLVALFISVGIFILLFQDSNLGRKKLDLPIAKHNQLNMVEHHTLIWSIVFLEFFKISGRSEQNHDDLLLEVFLYLHFLFHWRQSIGSMSFCYQRGLLICPFLVRSS